MKKRVSKPEIKRPTVKQVQDRLALIRQDIEALIEDLESPIRAEYEALKEEPDEDWAWYTGRLLRVNWMGGPPTGLDVALEAVGTPTDEEVAQALLPLAEQRRLRAEIKARTSTPEARAYLEALKGGPK